MTTAVSAVSDVPNDWKMSRTMSAKPVVGPGTYSPRHTQTRSRGKAFGFGTSQRFASSRQFLSSGHQTTRLCTYGPGPKYKPQGFPNRKQSPRYSCGPKTPTTREDRESKEAVAAASTNADLGPAAYNPTTKLTKNSPMKTKFAKSPRFHAVQPHVNEAFALRNHHVHTYKPAPNNYSPTQKSSSPRPSTHAFGPGLGKQYHRPFSERTSFMSADERVDNAQSATQEACIGSGDYMLLHENSSHHAPDYSFSKNNRFPTVDPQYYSKKMVEHTWMGKNSPGPKYHNKIGDISQGKKFSNNKTMVFSP